MILIFVIYLMLIGSTVSLKSTKKSFVNDLFKNYVKSERPVTRDEDEVYVNISLEIKNIIEFDITKGIMTSNLLLGLSWYDVNLMWNSENTNISYVKVELQKVWYPNVQICNSVTGKFTFDGNWGVTIKSDGSVHLHIDQIFHTYCKVNVNKYPFDEHECDISVCFEHQMNLEVMLHDFMYRVTYKPISNQWDYRYEYREVEKEEIITAGVIVYSKRKTSSVTVTKIIPPIMLTLLILSVYVLPASSGEKVSIAITVFLANIVFLSETEKKLGNNSREPSIYLIYLLILTLVSGLSSISSVIVCKLYAHESSASTISEKGQETNRSKTKIGIIGNADEPIIETKSKRRFRKCRIKYQMLDKLFLSATVLFLLLYIIIVSANSI
ncbi:acetylcholine receptor subunit beta-type unc-29 [Octopus bimaculoides]|nr:acetylcholine receptor subunit beta-type unc-29 [Octopus bimaculoides]|eukprot:XP_014778580.1 PREDICTED: acetylcholine receptor subunit beta-type unc-29-like [Octopus bimaculoides]